MFYVHDGGTHHISVNLSEGRKQADILTEINICRTSKPCLIIFLMLAINFNTF